MVHSLQKAKPRLLTHGFVRARYANSKRFITRDIQRRAKKHSIMAVEPHRLPVLEGAYLEERRQKREQKRMHRLRRQSRKSQPTIISELSIVDVDLPLRCIDADCDRLQEIENVADDDDHVRWRRHYLTRKSTILSNFSVHQSSAEGHTVSKMIEQYTNTVLSHSHIR